MSAAPPSSSVRGLLRAQHDQRRADRAGGDGLEPRRRVVRWLAAEGPPDVVANGLAAWLRTRPDLDAAALDALADFIDPARQGARL